MHLSASTSHQENRSKPDQQVDSSKDERFEIQFSAMNPSASTSHQENRSIPHAAVYKALREGNLTVVKSFSVEQLTAEINKFGDRALHIAVLNEHIEIVRELVNSLLPDPADLALRNNSSETALHLAAVGGIVEIAQLLVDKNSRLLTTTNKYGKLPLVMAAEFGHKRMVNFLYGCTPWEDLHRSTSGIALFKLCIATQLYDIAGMMLIENKDLALDAVFGFPAREIGSAGLRPGEVLNPLASRPAAFRCGSNISFWRRWIYSCVLPAEFWSSGTTLHHLGHSTLMFLKDYVPPVRHVYEEELEYVRARQLLFYISKKLGSRLYEKETENILFELLVNAVLCGNVEFIAEVYKIHPDLIWLENPEDDRPLLRVAVLNSQVEVYRFLLGLSKTKFILHTHVDKKEDSIVHQAAMLSPHPQLSSIPGPALQMQRELQWFKEVQKIAPAHKEFINKEGKTPGELFTEQHQELVREGEKWMKEIAKSCTVVAALIVTIMFAAPFTAPGGYEENTGIPIYLHSKNYFLFVVSDALSLFFSTTSVLVFLGILTSLYREEDFLKSLPTKLIIGLSTLFLSIAAMMVAFSAAILLMLRERLV